MAFCAYRFTLPGFGRVVWEVDEDVLAAHPEPDNSTEIQLANKMLMELAEVLMIYFINPDLKLVSEWAARTFGQRELPAYTFVHELAAKIAHDGAYLSQFLEPEQLEAARANHTELLACLEANRHFQSLRPQGPAQAEVPSGR